MALTLEELKQIRNTVLAMEDEIHHPGASRGNIHFLSNIDDALYRLLDAIERIEDQQRNQGNE